MRIELPSSIGFGTAPLGNMFRAIPEPEAEATLEAAWEAGLRFYDTAPVYGAGLAEERLGRLLGDRPRDEFVVSTKVGWMIADEAEAKAGVFADGHPNRMYFDYSESATLRSIEGSLARLGVDRIDYVWIHDLADDHHGEHWREAFDVAMAGAARALTRLRDEGVIRGWGLGVNRVEPCELALERADPDGFLLAGRYTLLDHERALETLFPECRRRELGIVVGGPYNSGLLAGGEHYEYQKAPRERIDQAARIRAICEDFGVDIRAAALQFCGAHPAVAAVIPGASRPARIRDNLALADAAIPAALWEALKREGILPGAAAVPAG